jgi:hypothetical protein
VAIAHIYREDLARVTASRNQLDLSLSKCIRHGLVTKINSKRRPRICEALGQISADYSRVCHAPAPIVVPRYDLPRPGEASERARVFLPFSTQQVHKEQPIF